MKEIILNNGIKMPQVGLGTFLIPDDKIIDVIGKAYDLGYRSFDTAWRYHNEHLIAKALKVHHIPREEVFITTKVNVDALYWGGKKWHSFFNIRRKTIKGAIEESFRNLNTDYVDLFLVHSPWYCYPEMYEQLTEFYHRGKIKAIGVSSFLPPMIDSLQKYSDVVPAINQFEISPLNTQKRLIKWCQDNNIVVEAMSTFSHRRSNEPRQEIIYNPIIKSIASKYGKSSVQVVLRWMYQQDIVLIPKTWYFEHLQENISIFDFELSDDEMASINTLDKGKFLNYNPYFEVKNIPKSFHDWDKYISF